MAPDCPRLVSRISLLTAAITVGDSSISASIWNDTDSFFMRPSSPVSSKENDSMGLPR